ncbi:MAG TPA: alpha-1,2-fucosyltransferase [Acidimicrobiales bacterium]|nr:alpha-1,2-fucosyltransferase [Acidimicrobiales bacterium]
MADDELRALFTLGEFGRPFGRIGRSVRYRVDRALRSYDVVKIGDSAYDAPAEVMAALRDRTHYAGFFQSEAFFADVIQTVREAYVPHPQHVSEFKTRYRHLLERPYICCHVRRTDYLQWGEGVALPVSYYTDALRSLELPPKTPVVFVGDDLSEVEAALGSCPAVRFERNLEVVDLLLMVHAAAFVSSNSSFSWWGAWLGPMTRSVLAPRFWLGFPERREYPPGVIPPHWAQLTVASESPSP